MKAVGARVGEGAREVSLRRFVLTRVVMQQRQQQVAADLRADAVCRRAAGVGRRDELLRQSHRRAVVGDGPRALGRLQRMALELLAQPGLGRVPGSRVRVYLFDPERRRVQPPPALIVDAAKLRRAVRASGTRSATPRSVSTRPARRGRPQTARQPLARPTTEPRSRAPRRGEPAQTRLLRTACARRRGARD
jgi:hypothetical protein